MFIEYGAVADLSQLKGAEIGMRGKAGKPARRAATQRKGRARTERAAPQGKRHKSKGQAVCYSPDKRSAPRSRGKSQPRGPASACYLPTLQD